MAQNGRGGIISGMIESSLEHKRHSLAHLLAAAVLELYGRNGAQPLLAIGPAIDSGFYYDIDFGADIKLSDDDLPRIEKRMSEILPTWTEVTSKKVDRDSAISHFSSPFGVNPYKAKLVQEISERKEDITLYTMGSFTDLCRGGHAENPAKDIKPGSWKLERIAGAYWRGDEKNKMLTRIYGLAFDTKEELTAYEKQMEEAKKRDHRKLGKELELFTFDDDVGPGLPLWLPNGTILTEELEKLAKETETAEGYKRVRTPHIAKESMYLTSGHLPYYQETMFPPMEYEGGKYYLKAMNCPHHHKIFAAKPRTYKELPLRLAEYGACYRHEKSGELFGLMRVRMLSMNDAHIYCSEEQFADEFRAVNDIYLKYFKIFGIGKYVMRFSTHDQKKLGEKYVNEPALWKKTEDMVRRVLIDSKIPYIEVANEAAFYGPKIDVQVWSAIGREFTLATNQVDFAVPKRFGLSYTGKDGKAETPLCIHRAPLGTHERFVGFLIEHYGGNFPLWLAPVQVKVVPVTEKNNTAAERAAAALSAAGLRVDLDTSDEGFGKKVRSAKVMKIPYFVIIGDKDEAAGKVTLESRDKGNLGALDLKAVIEKLGKENIERK